MGRIEILFVLIGAIVVIGAYVIAVKKIISSKMTSNQKILWILAIFFFNFPGLVVFLIYHEIYLSPALRGELRW
jgi:hypothetical protein